MSTRLPAVLAAACLALTGASASAQAHGALSITQAWSRPTPPGAPTAVGYLTITNHGRRTDRLTGATSPAAQKVEIHQMSMAGGVMRMRPVAGGLAIAPGQTVALAPGGYHLMLVGPRRQFKAGERIPVTLDFEHAGRIDVALDVGAGPRGPMGSMGSMSAMNAGGGR